MRPEDINDRVTRAAALIAADPSLSRRAAARAVGINESTLRLRGVRGGQPASEPEAVGLQDFGDGSATVSSDPADAHPWTPTSLLEAHGLVVDEWEIVSVRVNRWGDVEDPKQQLRVNAIRKDSLLQVPDLTDWTPLDPPLNPDYGDHSLVIAGDQHAPHHDKGLHRAFLGFLADEKPDIGILLGDTGDFSTISRHRTSAGFAQTVNQVNDAAVHLLQDYRESSPGTKWILLRGNHDDRLEYALQDHNPELYQVRPGQISTAEETPALNLRRLWHLDALGIELVDEEWRRAHYAITGSLTARHGYLVSENTGQQMLNKHSNSQVQGHSHRLRFTYRTKHDPLDVRVAVEAGTMAEIQDGLGYEDEPNWQQGFITGYSWEDGDFALAPAVYVHGKILLPDGRRYGSE